VSRVRRRAGFSQTFRITKDRESKHARLLIGDAVLVEESSPQNRSERTNLPSALTTLPHKLSLEISKYFCSFFRSSGIEGNILTVHGELQVGERRKEENYRRIERQYGSFTRSFTLPSSVDPSQVSAIQVSAINDRGVLNEKALSQGTWQGAWRLAPVPGQKSGSGFQAPS